jgi:predicted transcriptional regulator
LSLGDDERFQVRGLFLVCSFCDCHDATTNVLMLFTRIVYLERNFLPAQTCKRSHLQVIAEILDVCRQPQVKTKVLCEANISDRLFRYCLQQLLKQNMLQLHGRNKTYSTTSKGLRYLQLMHALQD